MNCWQSKCHAANHPTWGFEFHTRYSTCIGRRFHPRYQNASELHQNIALTMPWWNPGSLTEVQAWGVTAYLLHERGELWKMYFLRAGVAPVIRMHVPASQPADDKPMAILLIIMLSIAIIALAVVKDRSL